MTGPSKPSHIIQSVNFELSIPDQMVISTKENGSKIKKMDEEFRNSQMAQDTTDSGFKAEIKDMVD